MPPSAAVNAVGTRFTGINADDQLGANLRALDFDGDGYLDLYSGNSLATSGGTNRGVFSILEGDPSGIPSAVYTYRGEFDNDAVGSSSIWNHTSAASYAAKFVDLNADGEEEFIVKDYQADPSGNADAGSLYILPGGSFPASGIISTAWIRIDGTASGQQFGKNVYVEDLNQDSKFDLVAIRQDGSLFYQDGSKTGPINLSPASEDYFGGATDFGTNFMLEDITGDGNLDIYGFLNGDFGDGTGNGAFITIPYHFLPRD